ncbi:MAG: hypothetical protein HY841_11490 [Bacteroidetes bacterium]|nr:hypothetical protein [Bacteroidota bacterium]
MIPSKDLFELIKSLDKGERIHFNKYANLHSSVNKNYLHLFTAIDRQKEYDESKLQSGLKNHSFAKYFPVAKNYLHARLMDALANFHSDMSPHARIRTLIQQIELLQKKGLYAQSKKLIRKAKKVAYEEEIYHALLEIISSWELNIYIEKYDLAYAERMHHEIKEVLLRTNESFICNYTFLKILNLYYHYFRTRNNKYVKEAETAIRNLEFIKAENTNTFKGKQRALEANMFFWYLKGNLDKVSGFAQKGIEHNFTHPLGMKKDCKPYFILLNNFFVITMERKKHDEANLVLKKFESVSHFAKTHSQKGALYYTYNNCCLYYFRETGNLQTMEKQLPEILKDIDTYKKDINLHDRAILLANVAISNFYLGNYKKCVFFFNKLKTEYDLSKHPELQYGYYLLTLIAHYESKNYDVLPYSLQAFYRFLKKKEKINNMEKYIISLCRKLVKTNSDKETLMEFKKFKEFLSHTKDTHIYKFFDIISWLESKIVNRPFADVVREKQIHR